MSNPFELRITLRQHTPIIHFQHHQDGATLRASEVKPKLDRFLIEQIGKLHPIEKKVPYDAGVTYAKQQNWLIGDGDNGNALDYKMRIIAQAEPKSDLIHKGQSFPCFFANMGDEYDLSPKKFVLHAEPIKLYITCFDSDLKNFIDTHFHSFIAQTNFGMRQSKGFGSFSVDGQSFGNAVACFKVNTNNQNNCKALFSAVDIFYKSLRGGVRNYDGGHPCKFYFKSLLVAYYHKNAPKPTPLWDKEAIKHVLINRGTSTSNVDIKDLLGFSTTEKWGQRSIEKEDELTEALVDRFASPVIFKPVYDIQNSNWQIYLFLETIPETYKNATIVASLSGSKVKLKMWDGFNLKDFINAIEEYNDDEAFDKHISDYDRDDNFDNFIRHGDYNRLKAIFSTFKLL
jgi:hypothetical protein